MNRDPQLTSADDNTEHVHIVQPDPPIDKSLTANEELQLLQLLQKRHWTERRSLQPTGEPRLGVDGGDTRFQFHTHPRSVGNNSRPHTA